MLVLLQVSVTPINPQRRNQVQALFFEIYEHVKNAHLLADEIRLIPKDGALFVYARMLRITVNDKGIRRIHEDRGAIVGKLKSSLDFDFQPCVVHKRDLVSMKRKGFFGKTTLKGKNYKFEMSGVENGRQTLQIQSEDKTVNATYLLPCLAPKKSAVPIENSSIEWDIEWMPLSSATRRLKKQGKVANLVTFDIQDKKLVARFKNKNKSIGVTGSCIVHQHPIERKFKSDISEPSFFMNNTVCAALTAIGIKTVRISRNMDYFKVECKSDYFDFAYYVKPVSHIHSIECNV